MTDPKALRELIARVEGAKRYPGDSWRGYEVVVSQDDHAALLAALRELERLRAAVAEVQEWLKKMRGTKIMAQTVWDWLRRAMEESDGE